SPTLKSGAGTSGRGGMAPGGPLGLRGGNGRAGGGLDGGWLMDAGGADAGPGAWPDGGGPPPRGGAGGRGRGAGGGGRRPGGGAAGGADAARAGGFVVRLPFDFAGEFEVTVVRVEAGAAGAAEPVRAGRAMLGAGQRASGGPLPLGSICRQ